MQQATFSPSPDRIPIQIVLRPYASSLPLAAFAFGTGNVLSSALLLHWVPASQSPILAIVLLAFVAPLELFPSVIGFIARDTGSATAFAIFGASWIVQALVIIVSGGQKPSPMLGVFELSLVVCLAILMSVTFSGKPLIGVLLMVAILRDLGQGLVEFGVGAMATATAICGLLLAALAFFTALAFLDEDVKQRISPLTFRTGAAKEAMEGDLEDQISTITREAGIRKQL